MGNKQAVTKVRDLIQEKKHAATPPYLYRQC